MTCGLVHASYSLPESQAGDGKIGRTLGAIHSTKIPTGPTGKSGPPQKVDLFFRNFSGMDHAPSVKRPPFSFQRDFFYIFFLAQLPTGTHYIIILFLF